MIDISGAVIKVRKFTIDFEEKCKEYEEILNNPLCVIIRDEFYTDKMGLSHIVVWYREELD